MRVSHEGGHSVGHRSVGRTQGVALQVHEVETGMIVLVGEYHGEGGGVALLTEVQADNVAHQPVPNSGFTSSVIAASTISASNTASSICSKLQQYSCRYAHAGKARRSSST